MNNPEVLQALSIMARGMMGIFIALSILYGFIVILTKSFPHKEDEGNNNDLSS